MVIKHMSKFTNPRFRAINTVAAAVAVAIAAVAILAGSDAAAGSGHANLARTKDGLRWTVGSETATEVSLRSTADPAQCGSGKDATAGCVELRDDDAAATQPASTCDDVSRGRFRVRCGTSGMKNIDVVGGRGPRTDIVTDESTSKGCSPVTVTVTQVGGSGTTDIADGCRQIVRCTGGQYVGLVDADPTDTVDKGCAYVAVDGHQTREPAPLPRPCVCGGGGGSISPTPNVPPSAAQAPIMVPADPAASVARAGAATIGAVREMRLSADASAASLRLAVGSSLTVHLQKRTRKGFETIKTVRRASAPGVVHISLARSPNAPGTYRLAVRVPSTRRMLVSRSVVVSS
jgi:hypothetical protein